MAVVIGAKDRKTFERFLQTARMSLRDCNFIQSREITYHRILSAYAELKRAREKLDDKSINHAEACLEAWLYAAVERE